MADVVYESDGHLVKHDGTPIELAADQSGTATAILAMVVPDDLTGGQSPTEVEFNALLAVLRDLQVALGAVVEE